MSRGGVRVPSVTKQTPNPIDPSLLNTAEAIVQPAAPEPTIEIMQGVAAKDDQISLEAFMNEIVHVRIDESPDEGELPAVSVFVNDQQAVIPRGVDMVPIKRKFLEVLLRARTTNYEQMVEQRGADILTPLKRKDGLSYPVTVQDDSPKGRAWAIEVLKQRS